MAVYRVAAVDRLVVQLAYAIVVTVQMPVNLASVDWL